MEEAVPVIRPRPAKGSAARARQAMEASFRVPRIQAEFYKEGDLPTPPKDLAEEIKKLEWHAEQLRKRAEEMRQGRRWR